MIIDHKSFIAEGSSPAETDGLNLSWTCLRLNGDCREDNFGSEDQARETKYDQLAPANTLWWSIGRYLFDKHPLFSFLLSERIGDLHW